MQFAFLKLRFYYSQATFSYRYQKQSNFQIFQILLLLCRLSRIRQTFHLFYYFLFFYFSKLRSFFLQHWFLWHTTHIAAYLSQFILPQQSSSHLLSQVFCAFKIQHNIQNKSEMQALSIFRNYSNTKIRDPLQVLYYTITICISEIYFGYTLIYLSAIDFPVIAQVFSIDFNVHFAQGLFQAIVPVGGAIGAISSTYFISKLSRRQILVFFNFVAILLCILSLYPDYRLFFLVRFLQGACAGLFSSVVPIIAKENSPIQMSSITGSCPNLFIICGLVLSYFVGLVLGVVTSDMTGASSWKTIFLLPISFISTQTYLLWRVFPYETPKYLAQSNREQQLKTLLSKFYRDQFVSQLCAQNMQNYGQKARSSSSVQTSIYSSKTALFFGIFYAFLCPLVGINVMISYCGDVASGIFPSLKPILGTLMMLLYLIFSALSLPSVSKYGRKDITLWGTYGLVFTLYMITAGYFLVSSFPTLAQLLIFFSMVLYLFVYGMTFAPVMLMWLAQAIQPSLIGYAVMTNWAGAAIVMMIFPVIQQVVSNQGYIFAFFGTMALLSITVTKRLMIETKGKTDCQITEQYKSLDSQIWGQIQRNEHNQIQMNLMGGQKIK